MNQTNTDTGLKRSLGFGSAISIVFGTLVGSGIFFKQASVLDSAGTTTMAVIAWILGGIITLTGGLTVAEIGSQMPYTGGLYVYVENIYGLLAGFLAGWTQVIVYGPAIIGSVVGFMSLLMVNFFGLSAAWRLPLAILSIIFVAIINLFENRVGALFSIITTIAKLVPIAVIIIAGLFWGHEHALGQTVQQVTSTSAGSFGVAVLSTLFAYDGWILIANLGGEIKNSQKVLPQAIIWGILAVMAVYVLITLATFRFLPANQIHRLGQNTIAYLVNAVFGKIGGKLLSAGIIISMLGTLNGKILTFPRIAYAMAKRGHLPFSKQLAYLTPKGKSPVVATTLISVLAILMVAIIDPDRLSDLCVFSVYCFYMLAFVGIFILRKRQPGPRPFSTPLYPWIPIIAVLGGIFVLVSEAINDPARVILFLGIIIVGLPILFFLKKKHQEKL